MAQTEADRAWKDVELLDAKVTFHDIADGPRVMAITQQLKRKSAYDAAYRFSW